MVYLLQNFYVLIIPVHSHFLVHALRLLWPLLLLLLLLLLILFLFNLATPVEASWRTRHDLYVFILTRSIFYLTNNILNIFEAIHKREFEALYTVYLKGYLSVARISSTFKLQVLIYGVRKKVYVKYI